MEVDLSVPNQFVQEILVGGGDIAPYVEACRNRFKSPDLENCRKAFSCKIWDPTFGNSISIFLTFDVQKL